MTTLPERTLALMREIARTFLDGGDGVPEERLTFMVDEIRDLFRHVGVITRLALRLSVLFVQLAPLLVVGKLARFTSLSKEERLRYLDHLESGRFALAFVAVKTFICILYFEHPAALAETGFDGRALREAPSLLAPLAEGAAPR